MDSTGRYSGAVPILSLTQHSAGHRTRTPWRSERTLSSSHGQHRGSWRGRQEGQVLRWLLWPYSVGILPEQQLSNGSVCWRLHDTPQCFTWELSRFLISLHLSWLHFDKTAPGKPILSYTPPVFNSICDACRKCLGGLLHNITWAWLQAQQCRLMEQPNPSFTAAVDFSHAAGTLVGKIQVCFGQW